MTFIFSTFRFLLSSCDAHVHYPSIHLLVERYIQIHQPCCIDNKLISSPTTALYRSLQNSPMLENDLDRHSSSIMFSEFSLGSEKHRRRILVFLIVAFIMSESFNETTWPWVYN